MTPRAYSSPNTLELEEMLIREVRRAREADPLRSIDLLVGSNLLGLYLRRLLAVRLGAVACVRSLTFLDLAERLAAAKLLASRRRPLPPLGDELLIAQLTAALPAGSSFQPLKSFPGFQRTLLASIRDLKDAGWSPADLLKGAEGARLSGAARRKIADLAGLYARYARSLENASCFDRSDLLAEAVGEARLEAGSEIAVSPRSLLLAYGFYDLIELQRRILLAAAAGRETVVFVPSGEGPAFEFAQPFLDGLARGGFEVYGPDAAFEAHGPAAQLEGLFIEQSVDLDDLQNPVRGGEDESVIEFLAAPDETREAVEVARRVVEWAGQGMKFGEMAVLTRTGEPDAVEIARAFDRAGIPYAVHGGLPLARTRSARAFRMLLAIPEGGWSREDVMGFLSIADLDPGLAGVPGSVPADWDLVSSEAGIAGTREAWRPGLERFVARISRRLRREEEQTLDEALGGVEDDVRSARDIQALRHRLAAASSLLSVFDEVGTALDRWLEAGSWAQCGESLIGTVRRLVRPSEERLALEQAIASLGPLDALGPCPDQAAFLAFARRALEQARLPGGGLEKDGVFIAGLQAARGLTFRAVAVIGMCDGAIPVRGSQDPILLDDERRSLSGTSPENASLPIKGIRLPEERMIFRLAVGSARERLVLSWPRLSRGGTRETLASRFVREAAGAAAPAQSPAPVPAPAGRRAREQAFDAPTFRSVPVFPMADEDPDRAIDAAERGLARARKARPEDRPMLVNELARMLPFLPRALASERSRREHRVFGPFDGRLSGEVAQRAYGRFVPETIAPTRIEEYAACPLKAFFHRVLGLVPLVDPSLIESIERRERGILVHRILADFLRAAGGGSGGDSVLETRRGRAILDSAHAGALHELLRETARRQFLATEEANIVGYPLIWDVEQARILSDLDTWLEFELERWSAEPFTPIAVEWAFGRSAATDPAEGPAVTIDLPGGEVVRFAGRIDRIDLLGNGPRARLVDYKTGRVGGKPEEGVASGRSIQLPVYMLAAAGLRTAAGTPVEACAGEYLHLGPVVARGTLTSERLLELHEPLSGALESLLAAARSGDFTADPRDERFCQHCDYRAPCGEGRMALFRRKRGDPAVRERIALGCKIGSGGGAAGEGMRVE